MKKIIKWLDNYWYHYKWQTIIVAFFAFALTYLTMSTMQIRENDCLIMYGGPYQIQIEDREKLITSLSRRIGDVNGDGEVVVELADHHILSSEQFDEARDKAGEFFLLDENEIVKNRTEFANMFFASQAVICICDPSVYELLKAEGSILMPLEEVLDILPENALDEYSMRLSDTDAASKITQLRNFPSDTVICIRRMSEINAGSKGLAEEYEKQKEIFRDFVGEIVE